MILYRPAADGIDVLRFFDGTRDYEKLLCGGPPRHPVPAVVYRRQPAAGNFPAAAAYNVGVYMRVHFRARCAASIPMSVRASSNSADSSMTVASPSGREDCASIDCQPELAVRSFDGSDRDELVLLRDIVAIANSGGGQLLIRLCDCEQPIDANDLSRRLAQFTDAHFTDFVVEEAAGADPRNVRIRIGPAAFPIVFTRAGSAAADTTKRVEIFASGSLYFRNGQASELASSRQLQSFIERLLRRVRRRWLAGIRRVVNQPTASLVKPKQLAQRRAAAREANLQPVRIVTDPDAPALQPQDVDRLYPLRQKELVAELNRRLGRPALNSYDIQAVRRHHQLDERPDFVFHLPGAGRRYSPAAIEWIMDQYERDAEFFHKARAADSDALKLRRQKPR
jgi:hypothetical protein